MKNSVLYIVGALALLGGGAFLFLKNKKSKDASKLADFEKATLPPQGQATTPSTGAPSMGEFPAPKTPAPAPTPQVVIDSAKEMEANGLATQILGLKNQRLGLMTQSLLDTTNTSSAFGIKIANFTRQSQINALTSKINTLIARLKALGYKEVDGKAVKLVAVTTTKLV
jgi:LPXTG-motif cell wall-anchored protein